MSRIVYGANPVKEILASPKKSVTAVYIATRADGRVAQEIQKACRARDVPWDTKSPTELDALAGEGARHQGFVALAGEYSYAALNDVLSTEHPGPFVLLDCVQDPHNLGAVIRSTHVMGGRGVIVPQDRAAHVTPAVVKASAGATEHLPVSIVTNLVRSMKALNDAGIWTIGAVADEAAPAPWELDLTGPIAWVLGAEGTGLRRLVRERCDHQVRIPMAGHVASLNVSVAAGMLLYETARQRSGPQ